MKTMKGNKIESKGKMKGNSDLSSVNLVTEGGVFSLINNQMYEFPEEIGFMFKEEKIAGRISQFKVYTAIQEVFFHHLSSGSVITVSGDILFNHQNFFTI